MGGNMPQTRVKDLKKNEGQRESQMSIRIFRSLFPDQLRCEQATSHTCIHVFPALIPSTMSRSTFAFMKVFLGSYLLAAMSKLITYTVLKLFINFLKEI